MTHKIWNKIFIIILKEKSLFRKGHALLMSIEQKTFVLTFFFVFPGLKSNIILKDLL